MFRNMSFFTKAIFVYVAVGVLTYWLCGDAILSTFSEPITIDSSCRVKNIGLDKKVDGFIESNKNFNAAHVLVVGFIATEESVTTKNFGITKEKTSEIDYYLLQVIHDVNDIEYVLFGIPHKDADVVNELFNKQGSIGTQIINGNFDSLHSSGGASEFEYTGITSKPNSKVVQYTNEWFELVEMQAKQLGLKGYDADVMKDSLANYVIMYNDYSGMKYVIWGYAAATVFMIILIIYKIVSKLKNNSRQYASSYSSRGNSTFGNDNFGTNAFERESYINNTYPSMSGTNTNNIYPNVSGTNENKNDANVNSSVATNANSMYNSNSASESYGSAKLNIVQDEPGSSAIIDPAKTSEGYSSYYSVAKPGGAEANRQSDYDDFSDLEQFDPLNNAHKFSDVSTIGSNRAMQGEFGSGYNPSIDRNNSSKMEFGYVELPIGTYMKSQMANINRYMQAGDNASARKELLELTRCDEVQASEIIMNWERYYN